MEIVNKIIKNIKDFDKDVKKSSSSSLPLTQIKIKQSNTNDCVYNICKETFSTFIKASSFINKDYIWTKFPQQIDYIDSYSEFSQNSVIKAMVVDKLGRLYIGGDFNKIGNLICNRIAMWDGKSWNNLGIGIEGQVTVMAIDKNNNLWVGGSISKSGSIPCSCIAKWNWKLKVWEQIEGVNSNVMSIVVSAFGTIVIGGSFNLSDSGTVLASAAVFNDLTNKWINIGADYMINKPIYAMAIDKKNNLVYAGGFTGFPVSKYNFTTNSWTKLSDNNGNEFSELVNTIVIDPNTSSPIFGGAFTYDTVNFIPNLHNVVKYDVDSKTWIPLNNPDGFGLNSQCYKLFWDRKNNRLIAGGFFSYLTNGNVEGENLNRIAIYDGTQWLKISDGINGSGVESIEILMDGTILFGGNFVGANNQLWSNSLIAWSNDYVQINWKGKFLYTLTNFERDITISVNNCVQYIFEQVI